MTDIRDSPPAEGQEALDAKTQAASPDVASSAEGNDPEKTTPPKAPATDVPDGGLAAWLVVLGAWCTSFCSFGWMNSIGVFQEFYQDDLLKGYSASTISWIPSLQVFFMMAMGPVIGSIYDRYGPRWLLLIGSFLHVFGIMMASLSTQYYQILLAQGLCSAIGVSAIFQPSVNSVLGWFNRRRATAFGILFTGSSIGGVLFPIMLSNMIREVGFGWAMRTAGFIILFLLIIANLTVRSRVPPFPQKVTGAQLIKPLKEADFVLVALNFFFFSYGFFVPVNYLPIQALEAGMSPHLAGYLLPLLNAGSFFGRFFCGYAADKLGRYNVYIAACYLSGIWILALWLPTSSTPATIAFAILFGFFSGVYVSLITPMLMQISPMAEIGFRSGIVLLLTALGGLTTIPINGAILSSTGAWGLKVFCGIMCIVGTTFALIVRVRRTGPKLLARF